MTYELEMYMKVQDLKKKLDVATAFHELAVKQRDLAWRKCDRLTELLREALYGIDYETRPDLWTIISEELSEGSNHEA